MHVNVWTASRSTNAAKLFLLQLAWMWASSEAALLIWVAQAASTLASAQLRLRYPGPIHFFRGKSSHKFWILRTRCQGDCLILRFCFGKTFQPAVMMRYTLLLIWTLSNLVQPYRESLTKACRRHPNSGLLSFMMQPSPNLLDGLFPVVYFSSQLSWTLQGDFPWLPAGVYSYARTSKGQRRKPGCPPLNSLSMRCWWRRSDEPTS
jgi:hypothetical protein